MELLTNKKENTGRRLELKIYQDGLSSEEILKVRSIMQSKIPEIKQLLNEALNTNIHAESISA